MKSILLFLLVAASASLTSWADDLEKLQGKWTAKKSGDQGSYTQRFEVKKNQWTFKVIGADDAVVLVATGELELKKQGPFSSLRLFKMKAGRSEAELEDVSEERNSVYILDETHLFVASNFDQLRGSEKPTVDSYSRAN